MHSPFSSILMKAIVYFRGAKVYFVIGELSFAFGL